MSLDYEREPAAIYRQSFATVEAEADLSGLPEDARPVAVRLIHACGMVEIAPDIVCSPELVAAATAALSAGAPILCDCEMVRSGVIRRMLPSENNVIATIGDGGIPDLAGRIGNTRSAAAVELWRDHLAGSVVAVGNAPTALFHLLNCWIRTGPNPLPFSAFRSGLWAQPKARPNWLQTPAVFPSSR